MAYLMHLIIDNRKISAFCHFYFPPVIFLVFFLWFKNKQLLGQPKVFSLPWFIGSRGMPWFIGSCVCHGSLVHVYAMVHWSMCMPWFMCMPCFIGSCVCHGSLFHVYAMVHWFAVCHGSHGCNG